MNAVRQPLPEPRLVGDRGITLFIDPVTYHFERNRLFSTQTQWHGGDTVLEPYRYLREWMAQRGVRVHTGDALLRGEGLSERNLYVSLGTRHRYGKLVGRDDVALSAFIVMDCPAVEPRLYTCLSDAAKAFKRIYSFSTAEALRPFLRGPVELLPFHIPQSWDVVHDDVWANDARRFLTMVNSNKLPRDYTNELYSERLRAVEFFARTAEIDLYGVGWAHAPFQLGETWVPRSGRRIGHHLRTWWLARRPTPELAAARAAYGGPLRDKAQTLGRYRFALVIENMALEGWVTEKIFDCFYTGTVPVYFGAPDVERWIPRECFIDMRLFDSYEDLGRYLRSLSDAEVGAYREAARDFVGSDAFRPFSKQAHAEVFGRIVEEDAGVRLEA